MWVVAVLIEMFRHQRGEQAQSIRRQMSLLAEDVAERLTLVEQPGVHRRDQGVFGNEIQLHGKDAEQQVAVGGRRHGQASAKT